MICALLYLPCTNTTVPTTGGVKDVFCDPIFAAKTVMRVEHHTPAHLHQTLPLIMMRIGTMMNFKSKRSCATIRSGSTWFPTKTLLTVLTLTVLHISRAPACDSESGDLALSIADCLSCCCSCDNEPLSSAHGDPLILLFLINVLVKLLHACDRA